TPARRPRTASGTSSSRTPDLGFAAPPLGGNRHWRDPRRAACSFKITMREHPVNAFARRTASALVYLVSAAALAPAVFGALLAGWLAALLLAITPASVPVLLGFRWTVRQLALVEAWLARELLGVRAYVPAAP